ncbi:MAG: hypothetical protein OXU20_28005 [Myxococcales bacterium]|nr:hypothetical protein [Myxococcales bacterium]MDD9966391.1 hypothetical protein [Myxococcales bacterium]
MSVAVAVQASGQVVIAADSKRTFGSGAVPQDNLSDAKIRKVGGAYLAATGWGIYANILDDHLARRPRARLTDSASIFQFFTHLWKVLHERYSLVNDQCSGDDSPFGDMDASFLVTNRTGIYYVACDMSVTRFEQYCAIGSGGSYAMGALHALYRPSGDAARIATRAVEAASALDIYCGPPVQLEAITLPAPRTRRRKR